MKVKIPSPKSEFVKKAFVILVTGILPFSLIVNKLSSNIDSSFSILLISILIKYSQLSLLNLSNKIFNSSLNPFNLLTSLI